MAILDIYTTIWLFLTTSMAILDIYIVWQYIYN